MTNAKLSPLGVLAFLPPDAVSGLAGVAGLELLSCFDPVLPTPLPPTATPPLPTATPPPGVTREAD